MCKYMSEFIFWRLEWIKEKKISFDDIVRAQMCGDSFCVSLWVVAEVQYAR